MEGKSNKPQKWEIWHARFNYDGQKGYKYRPIIVIDISKSGMLVMMITSATNKLRLPHDYLITNWQQAGLDKPSIARVDRIAEIPTNYLGTSKRIGQLSKKDVTAITAILHEIVTG